MSTLYAICTNPACAEVFSVKVPGSKILPGTNNVAPFSTTFVCPTCSSVSYVPHVDFTIVNDKFIKKAGPEKTVEMLEKLKSALAETKELSENSFLKITHVHPEVGDKIKSFYQNWPEHAKPVFWSFISTSVDNAISKIRTGYIQVEQPHLRRR